jgi:polysaccharide pyruvyl transferase WcaK-like protein
LGGGTLIGDNLADGSNPFRERFATVLNRTDRAVVFGTGVGMLSGNGSPDAWLLEWEPLLRKCSYIGVRGPESVRSLEAIGIRAELLGDPACILAEGAGYWTPGPKALGVNIGAIKDGPAIDALLRFVGSKISEGWQPTFFDVCIDDAHIVRERLRRLGHSGVPLRTIYTDSERYLEEVRSMTAFVGIRLHSVILAMCAGVPSVMLAYAPKCNDFMSSVDLCSYAINVSDLTFEALSSRFEELYSKRQELGESITRRMRAFRDLQLNRAAQLVA